MTTTTTRTKKPRSTNKRRLVGVQERLKRFLFLEAELLDDRRFREWYHLLATTLVLHADSGEQNKREMTKRTPTRSHLAFR